MAYCSNWGWWERIRAMQKETHRRSVHSHTHTRHTHMHSHTPPTCAHTPHTHTCTHHMCTHAHTPPREPCTHRHHTHTLNRQISKPGSQVTTGCCSSCRMGRLIRGLLWGEFYMKRRIMSFSGTFSFKATLSLILSRCTEIPSC